MISVVVREADSGESSSHHDEGTSSYHRGGLTNLVGKFSSSVSEIEEESSSTDLFEIHGGDVSMASIKEEVESSLFSYDVQTGDDVVYVSVGKSEDSSMDALVWTLNHAIKPLSTVVYLIHVFPELRHIPTPLGKLPISQANPEQKESYTNQERSKRREFLQKYLDKCSAYKVQVETILIESDMEAKAVLDLIPVLYIRNLVVGTTKPNLRKMRAKKGSGIAFQILQNAPEFCGVKVICEGKEVVDQMIQCPSPRGNEESPKLNPQHDQVNDSFRCSCFKPKAIVD